MYKYFFAMLLASSFPTSIRVVIFTMCSRRATVLLYNCLVLRDSGVYIHLFQLCQIVFVCYIIVLLSEILS